MLGNDRMLYRRGASQSATFVVAASDSLHQGYADYVCDGVDDQVEIQAAIDMLAAIGGDVCLMEGHYYISSPIIIVERSIRLHGVSRTWGTGGTHIILADNSNCNMIEINADNTILLFVTLDTLFLHGNKDNQTSGHGIVYNATNYRITDAVLENVGISSVKEDGIVVTGSPDIWLFSFTNVWVEYCGGYGIRWDDGTHPRFTKVHSSHNMYGMLLKSCRRASIAQCSFEVNDKDGLVIEDSYEVQITNCDMVTNGKFAQHLNYYDLLFNEAYNVNVVGCDINADGWNNYAVGILYNSDYIVLVGNTILSGYLGAVYHSTDTNGSNPHGKENFNVGDYNTENSGTATLLNGTTSIVVDHGLDVTPSAGDIMVTPIGSLGSASFFYIDSYTSTQFTIHVDVNPGQDVDFAWKAIVL